jgi:Secretion system C-terminal sorting domain
MKRFKYLCLYITCFSSILINAQTSATDTAFVRTFGGYADEEINDITQVNDNGFVLIGSTNSYVYSPSAIYIVKTDSAGIHQWSSVISDGNISKGKAIVETADHGLVICGYTNAIGYGGYDMLLLKTDSVGNVLWKKTYGGSDWDFGYGLTALADGGFVICGETYSKTHGGTDGFVVRTNNVGDTIWTKRFGGALDDNFKSVIVLHNDSIALIGKKTIAAGNEDFYFAKLDLNGNLLYSNTYGTPQNDFGNDLCLSTTDDVFLVGTSFGFSTSNYSEAWIVKLSSTGQIMWSNNYGGPEDDEGNSIIQVRNGNVVMTGLNRGFGWGSSALYELRVSEDDGSWKSSASFGWVDEESGNVVLRTNSGGIVFGGYTSSYGSGGRDMYMIKMYSDAVVPEYILSNLNYDDALLTQIKTNTNAQHQISFYPNPLRQEALFNINLPTEDCKHLAFEVYNTLGEKVFSENISNTNSYLFKRKSLPAGMYYYSLQSAQHVYSGKLIIE